MLASGKETPGIVGWHCKYGVMGGADALNVYERRISGKVAGGFKGRILVRQGAANSAGPVGPDSTHPFAQGRVRYCRQ